MLTKSYKKYVLNPAITLIPFILFIILHCTLKNEQMALSISVVAAILGEIICRSILKTRIYTIPFFIVGMSLGITLLVWFLFRKTWMDVNIYYVICEVLIITFYMIIRALKTFINIQFFKKSNFLQKALLKEVFEIGTFVQYALTLHLMLILIYTYVEMNGSINDPNIARFILFVIAPVVIILGIMVYEILKVKGLSTQLKKEEWLPIVTEKGEVTGKIAKSVSMGMSNKFRHPVVRIALISGEKVYLQERAKDDIISPGKLDHPFGKYMLFSHDINMTARNSISRMVDFETDVDIKFVLKYAFENDNVKRLIFLFIVRVSDENSIKKTDKMHGKFWSIKQIEDAFSDEAFSECFELEYEYLKNMILIPELGMKEGEIQN